MPLTTDFRQEVAAALGVLDVKVYTHPVPVPIPPAVVLVWDTPWLTPSTVSPGGAFEVRLRALCLVDGRKADTAYLAAEKLVEDAIKALPDGVAVVDATAPLLTDLGAQGTALVADISLLARIA